jgi:hypothetical protein
MNNDFVDVIFQAIARQEGALNDDPNDIPSRQNNPLDLRYAGQIGASRPKGTVVKRGQEPIAMFATLAHGIAAGYRQLWLDIARGMSLRELIEAWAPPSENDTATYIKNVQRETKGLIDDPDRPLLEYLRL